MRVSIALIISLLINSANSVEKPKFTEKLCSPGHEQDIFDKMLECEKIDPIWNIWVSIHSKC